MKEMFLNIWTPKGESREAGWGGVGWVEVG